MACYLLRGVGEAVVPMLPELLRNCWKTEIYLLRIQVLELIEGVSRGISDAHRSELASLLNSLDYAGNLILSTAIVDALARLDALEPVSSPEDAENEFRAVLIKPNEPSAQEQAYHLLMRMFEEIFQDSYCEAIGNLSIDNYTLLFTMAALGAPEWSLSKGYILGELGRKGDARAVQAFSKYAVLPDAKANHMHDAVEAFAWAVVGLSRYEDNFPQIKRPMTADEFTWYTLGEILFWMHKPRLPDQGGRSQCAPLWRRLIDGFAIAAVDPLMRLERVSLWRSQVGTEGLRVVKNVFKDEVRVLLERALGNLEGLSSLFEVGKWAFFSEERQAYVIRALGEIGNRETVAKLQVFADHPRLGVIIVEAIRKLNREMS